MEHAAAIVLVLFGCSDDLSQCQRLPRQELVSYASFGGCEAGQPAALGSEAALAADYPTVVVQCMSMRQLAALGRTVDLNHFHASSDRTRTANAFH